MYQIYLSMSYMLYIYIFIYQIKLIIRKLYVYSSIFLLYLYITVLKKVIILYGYSIQIYAVYISIIMYCVYYFNNYYALLSVVDYNQITVTFF